MPGDARITRWQLAMIWVGFLLGSSTLVVPSGAAGRDGWISAILGGVLGLLEAVLLLRLAARFPAKLPAEIFMDCAGKVVGTLLAVLYVWFCFHLGSLVIRNVVEAYFATVFTRTPESVVTSVMSLLIIVAVYLGIEVMARTTEILSPALVLNIVTITVLSVATKGLLRPDEILPILENGWIPVLKGAWASFAFPFGEAVVLLSVLPYAADEKRAMPYVLGAVSLVALLLTGVAMRNIMALGVSNEEFLFPSLGAVGLISVGIIIQRLDAFLLFVWTFGVFIKAAVCLFAAAVNLKVLLGLRDVSLLAFPCGALMATLSSYVEKNAVDMVDFAAYAWPPYSFPFEVMLPLGILVLAVLRKKGKVRRRGGEGK